MKLLAALAVMVFAGSNAYAEDGADTETVKTKMPIWAYTIDVADNGDGFQTINFLLEGGKDTEKRKVDIAGDSTGPNVCQDHDTEPSQREFNFYITASQSAALIALLQNAKKQGDLNFSCWNDSDGDVQMQVRAGRVLPE